MRRQEQHKIENLDNFLYDVMSLNLMVYYYLDLETYGKGKQPDPEKDKIISILLCAFDPSTGKRIQEPIFLKAWKTSEEAIVKDIAARLAQGDFRFIPVGFGLSFDFWFLQEKIKKYLGKEMNLADRPCLDLKHVAVFANKGRFKGIRIGASGNPVRDWYDYEDYKSIEQFSLEKLEKFTELYKQYLEKL